MEDSGEIEDSFLDDSTIPETPPISPPEKAKSKPTWRQRIKSTSEDEVNITFQILVKFSAVYLILQLLKPLNLRKMNYSNNWRLIGLF